MASVSLNILPKYEYMVDACLATTHMYVCTAKELQ